MTNLERYLEAATRETQRLKHDRKPTIGNQGTNRPLRPPIDTEEGCCSSLIFHKVGLQMNVFGHLPAIPPEDGMRAAD
jgi:hypothetical protein